MRVVHIVRQFHPGVGGLESFVHALVKEQRAQGVNAEVITLNRLFNDLSDTLPEYDCVEGVPTRRISFWGSTRYPIAPSVISCLDSFDVVHVHGVDFFCDYFAIFKILHGKPLVLSTHGGFFHTGFGGYFKHIYFNTITRLSLKSYKRVFACSINDEKIFKKIAARKVVRIDNGADIDKFALSSSATFRPTLIYFGRFSENKCINQLIEAFDETCNHLPDAHLHIMGHDWANLLPSFRACIGKLQRGTAITLHVGPSNDEIRSVIARSTFFVSASNYEGFGLALVEALGAGLIPLVSNIPSFSSIIDESRVGRLLTFDNPHRAGKQMAAYMATAAGDHSHLRESAIALAQKYSWPKVAQRFVQEYRDIGGLGERRILGVRVRSFSRNQAIARIDRALTTGQRLNISFANAHTLNIASTDKIFGAALRNFIVLNDGVGVDIASRVKFGRPFIANLNGTDFVPDFLQFTQHNLRIYLLGTTEVAVSSAKARLAALYPRHTIVGARNGFFFTKVEHEEACSAIRASQANCVLVGMGNPLQELWISEHGDKTGATLLFAVGALLDFAADRVRRAPPWIRQLRCEWVYRLFQEPRRLARRYLVGNVAFLSRVFIDARR